LRAIQITVMIVLEFNISSDNDAYYVERVIHTNHLIGNDYLVALYR